MIETEKVKDVIQKIYNQIPQGDGKKYIYRGENKKNKKVCSTLYRHIKEYLPENPNINNNAFLTTIEDEIVEKAKKHFSVETTKIEILSELQHYGGKTNLIDFSRNFYIALFFACDGEPKEKEGRIVLSNCDNIKELELDQSKIMKGLLATKNPSIFSIIDNLKLERTSQILKDLRKSRIDSITDKLSLLENLSEPNLSISNGDFEHIKQLYNTMALEELKIIEPLIQSNRAKFQRSVFIYTPIGYLEETKYSSIVIQAKYKKPILNLLKNSINIHTDTIYNDIHGLIKNENSYLTPTFYFCKGLSYSKKGSYEDAIKSYDEAIFYNPKFIRAFYNIGLTYYCLGKYKEAIENFDEVTKLNAELRLEAFLKKGEIKLKLKKYEKAIEDFDKVIAIFPSHWAAFSHIGSAQLELGKYKEAIINFSYAIEFLLKDANTVLYNEHLKVSEDIHINSNCKAEIQSKLAIIFQNRSGAKNNLKDYEEAILDLEEAKKLYKEAGKSQMVGDCEEIIKKLKKQV